VSVLKLLEYAVVPGTSLCRDAAILSHNLTTNERMAVFDLDSQEFRNGFSYTGAICDGLFFFRSAGGASHWILVELKGNDLNRAVTQIEDTCSLLKSQGVISRSSNVHGLVLLKQTCPKGFRHSWIQVKSGSKQCSLAKTGLYKTL
jgi:hypothetical protein